MGLRNTTDEITQSRIESIDKEKWLAEWMLRGLARMEFSLGQAQHVMCCLRSLGNG